MEDNQETWSLHSATRMKEFSYVNHNDTDFERFREFSEGNKTRFQRIEKERFMKEVKANLIKWNSVLPKRWKGASLASIDSNAASKAAKIIHSFKSGSFFIHGNAGTGKTYLAYAIIKRLVTTAQVSPSQVKVVSEDQLMAYAKMGFEGMSLISKVLDPVYKVFLFDGVGSRESYSATREALVWDQIIDHVHANSLCAIFTSNDGMKAFSEVLNDSNQSKLKDIVRGRVLVTGEVEDKVNKKSKSDLDLSVFND